jgi:hypothetical protein
MFFCQHLLGGLLEQIDEVPHLLVFVYKELCFPGLFDRGPLGIERQQISFLVLNVTDQPILIIGEQLGCANEFKMQKRILMFGKDDVERPVDL